MSRSIRWMVFLHVVLGLAAHEACAHPGGHGAFGLPFHHRAQPAPVFKPAAPVIPIQLVSAPRPGQGLANVAIDDAFETFQKLGGLQTRRDGRYFCVAGSGLPDHPLMVGIRAWQQQVPIPQPYHGDNAWRIPLEPVPAAKPLSAKNRFLRGAIALAVNGIPIFNPLNNRGEDAFAIGELDDFGGHCGRADDYHYHIAPVHLEEQLGKGMPIAFALDGYPVYGYTEPDGQAVTGLDALNGHEDAAGNYHYHATKNYPYLNGGFHGEVTERDGQVDPQPEARPLREAKAPLRGATIVGFETTGEKSWTLTYEIGGRKGTVAYSFAADGSATFRSTDPAGKTTEETARPRGRRPGGGREKGNGREPPSPPPLPAGRAAGRAPRRDPERTSTSDRSHERCNR